MPSTKNSDEKNDNQKQKPSNVLLTQLPRIDVLERKEQKPLFLSDYIRHIKSSIVFHKDVLSELDGLITGLNQVKIEKQKISGKSYFIVEDLYAGISVLNHHEFAMQCPRDSNLDDKIRRELSQRDNLLSRLNIILKTLALPEVLTDQQLLEQLKDEEKRIAKLNEQKTGIVYGLLMAEDKAPLNQKLQSIERELKELESERKKKEQKITDEEYNERCGVVKKINQDMIDNINKAIQILEDNDALTWDASAFLHHSEPLNADPKELEKQIQRGKVRISDRVIGDEIYRTYPAQLAAAHQLAKAILHIGEKKAYTVSPQSSTLYSPLSYATESDIPSSPPYSSLTERKNSVSISVAGHRPSISETVVPPSYEEEKMESPNKKEQLLKVIESHRSQFTTITKEQFEAALAKYKLRWKCNIFQSASKTEEKITGIARAKVEAARQQSNLNIFTSAETELFISNLEKHFKNNKIYVCTEKWRDYLAPKVRFKFFNQQKAFAQALMHEKTVTEPAFTQRKV